MASTLVQNHAYHSSGKGGFPTLAFQNVSWFCNWLLVCLHCSTWISNCVVACTPYLSLYDGSFLDAWKKFFVDFAESKPAGISFLTLSDSLLHWTSPCFWFLSWFFISFLVWKFQFTMGEYHYEQTIRCMRPLYMIGVSLSKPHTSMTALRTCVCMLACLLACGYIP